MLAKLLEVALSPSCLKFDMLSPIMTWIMPFVEAANCRRLKTAGDFSLGLSNAVQTVGLPSWINSWCACPIGGQCVSDADVRVHVQSCDENELRKVSTILKSMKLKVQVCLGIFCGCARTQLRKSCCVRLLFGHMLTRMRNVTSSSISETPSSSICP
eukprot:784967-Rhodomonas_salina.16